MVGVEVWVEEAGWLGGMVKVAGGRETLKLGSRARTDRPEARMKADARPLKLGDACGEIPCRVGVARAE